jgi:hypothetical protein
MFHTSHIKDNVVYSPFLTAVSAGVFIDTFAVIGAAILPRVALVMGDTLVHAG